jgi:phage tail sheath protein FI
LQYVNIRRYFLYLEHSISGSTNWVVFEPNGPALWASITTSVSDFLYNEWFNGRLAGSRPADAFFVRCDRTTMTQADLDNGRLVCLIGVAPLEPAEFVIFRIGQMTAG